MDDISGLEVGTIGAALIVAVVSLIGLVTSKENKISEFRQDWIDALRLEVADIIAKSNAIQEAKRDSGAEIVSSGDWSIVHRDFSELANSSTKIQLRLNTTEKHSISIVEAVNKIKELSYPSMPSNPDLLLLSQDHLIEETQHVLKEEWERVKKGEQIFKRLKMGTFLALFLLTAAFIAFITDPLLELIKRILPA